MVQIIALTSTIVKGSMMVDTPSTTVVNSSYITRLRLAFRSCYWCARQQPSIAPASVEILFHWQIALTRRRQRFGYDIFYLNGVGFHSYFSYGKAIGAELDGNGFLPVGRRNLANFVSVLTIGSFYSQIIISFTLV
jgi:hypothetical protein